MAITEKLVLPRAYGQTTQTLAWEQVRAQLGQAKQYWLATNPGCCAKDAECRAVDDVRGWP